MWSVLSKSPSPLHVQCHQRKDGGGACVDTKSGRLGKCKCYQKQKKEFQLPKLLWEIEEDLQGPPKTCPTSRVYCFHRKNKVSDMPLNYHNCLSISLCMCAVLTRQIPSLLDPHLHYSIEGCEIECWFASHPSSSPRG